MGWEDQGRQGHGWFGNGTGPGVAEAAAGVAADVVGLLPVVRRGAFGRYLRDGGLDEMREALPVWAGASGLDGRTFRRLVVGPALGGAAASSLQDAGRAFAAGDLAGASVGLAAAVASEPSGVWRHGLGYARDQAVYSLANGRVVGLGEGGAASGDAGVVEVRQAATRGMPGFSGFANPVVPYVPGSRENEANTRRLEPFFETLIDWLRRSFAAPGDDGATAGSEGAGSPSISPMQPPGDAKDPTGPKAPGKPGPEVGFEDPKGGEQWVRAPNGRGYGWLDKNGEIWVPTGTAGAPATGTTGNAHSGPHWDVQSKNGKSYRNVRPREGG